MISIVNFNGIIYFITKTLLLIMIIGMFFSLRKEKYCKNNMLFPKEKNMLV